MFQAKTAHFWHKYYEATGSFGRKKDGSVPSQHVLGQAADITGGSKAENRKLFDLVRSLKLPFDQLIWEHGGARVHVSCGPRNRRQVLSISK